MLELVLKEPENKPPFIGIVFESSYNACKENADLVERFKQNPKTEFWMGIEVFSNYCDIKLQCSNPIGIRFYRKIKYSPEKLQQWMRQTRFKPAFNFSHLLRDGDKHVVVKTLPDQFNFVLKLQTVKLQVGEQHYI